MARKNSGLTQKEYAKWRNLNCKVFTYRARCQPILDEILLEIKEWQLDYEKLMERKLNIMGRLK
jgi:hypothetical protein